MPATAVHPPEPGVPPWRVEAVRPRPDAHALMARALTLQAAPAAGLDR